MHSVIPTGGGPRLLASAKDTSIPPSHTCPLEITVHQQRYTANIYTQKPFQLADNAVQIVSESLTA